MHWFDWVRVVEFFLGFFVVAFHGECDMSLCVVPLQVYAEVFASCPIDFYGVFGFDGVKEVVGISFSCVFYLEVVDDQGEADGSVAV